MKLGWKIHSETMLACFPAVQRWACLPETRDEEGNLQNIFVLAI